MGSKHLDASTRRSCTSGPGLAQTKNGLPLQTTSFKMDQYCFSKVLVARSFEFAKTLVSKVVGNSIWHNVTRLVFPLVPWDERIVSMPRSACSVAWSPLARPCQAAPPPPGRRRPSLLHLKPVQRDAPFPARPPHASHASSSPLQRHRASDAPTVRRRPSARRRADAAAPTLLQCSSCFPCSSSSPSLSLPCSRKTQAMTSARNSMAATATPNSPPLRPIKEPPSHPSQAHLPLLSFPRTPCFFSCRTVEPCSDSVEIVAVGPSAVASSRLNRSSIKSAWWLPLIPSSSRTTHSSRWWPEASYPSGNHRRRARRAHPRGGTSGAPPCPWSTSSEAAQRGGPPHLPAAVDVHQGGGGRWRPSRPCCAGRSPEPLHRGKK